MSNCETGKNSMFNFWSKLHGYLHTKDETPEPEI